MKLKYLKKQFSPWACVDCKSITPYISTCFYSCRHPITSMVYGTNALVVKPAISLAPMVVVNILNRYGYDQLQKNILTESQVDALKSTMFTLLCCIPFMVGILQSCFWSYYTIRENKKVNMAINVGLDLEES